MDKAKVIFCILGMIVGAIPVVSIDIGYGSFIEMLFPLLLFSIITGGWIGIGIPYLFGRDEWRNSNISLHSFFPDNCLLNFFFLPLWLPLLIILIAPIKSIKELNLKEAFCFRQNHKGGTRVNNYMRTIDDYSDLTNKIRSIEQDWKEEQEQQRKDAELKEEQQRKDAELKEEQRRKDAKLRAEQRRKDEELMIIRITNQVLKCNPKRIAQELMSKLEENATAAVKRGERKSEASLIFWQTEYYIYMGIRSWDSNPLLETIKAEGPIISCKYDYRKASEILFSMVKEHITDTNIKLNLEDISDYDITWGEPRCFYSRYSEGRKGQSIKAYINW